MHRLFPAILAELAVIAMGGMADEWLPISSGWIWAVVAIVSVFGLLSYYRFFIRGTSTSADQEQGSAFQLATGNTTILTPEQQFNLEKLRNRTENCD